MSRQLVSRASPASISGSGRLMSTKISVNLIKDLRAKSGAPMMECKKALMDEEVGGDVDKAMDYLRAKGIAKASNNTRVAAEGLIGVYEKDGICTIVEVNSETDFVSRNESFQDFVAKIAVAANTLGVQGAVGSSDAIDISTLLTLSDSGGPTIQSMLGDIVASIRENIVIRRAVNLPSNQTNLLSAVYVHGKLGGDASGVQLGRESSVVTFSTAEGGAVTEDQRTALSTAAKRLAMHIVAAKPQYLSISDVPQDVQQSEAMVMREQTMKNPPKNMDMLEKIIEAKVNKRLAEICLTGQAHMAVEGAPVIAKYIKELAKENGLPELELKGYKHWSLGQESS